MTENKWIVFYQLLENEHALVCSNSPIFKCVEEFGFPKISLHLTARVSNLFQILLANLKEKNKMKNSQRRP